MRRRLGNGKPRPLSCLRVWISFLYLRGMKKSKPKDTRIRHAHAMPPAMRTALKELAEEHGQTFVGYINLVLGQHLRRERAKT